MSPFTDFLQAEHRFCVQLTEKLSRLLMQQKEDKMSSIHQLLQNRTSCCKVSQAQPQPVALVTESNHSCPDLDHPPHQTRVSQTAEGEGSLLGAGKGAAQPTWVPRGLATALLTDSSSCGSNKFKTLKLKQRKELVCFWESCTGWCQAQHLHSEL